MISLIRAAWQTELRVPMFVGKSTDGYPSKDDPAMKNGARCYHIDTGKEWEYSVDDDHWYQVSSGGGSGGTGIDIVVGWKAGTVPDVTKIPAGVQVVYEGTTYIGTKVASEETKGQIVLISIAGGSQPNLFNEYVTYKDGDNYGWEMIGTTEVNLDGYARQVVIGASSNKTVNGYQVPKLTDAQLLAIYNGVVAGDSVVITDANGMMHFEGINADMVSGEVFITFRYFDKMVLEYAEGDVTNYHSLLPATSFSCEMADGTTRILTINGTLV